MALGPRCPSSPIEIMSSNFLPLIISTLLRRKRWVFALGLSVVIHGAFLITMAALLPAAQSPSLPGEMQIDVQEQRLSTVPQVKAPVSPVNKRTTPHLPPEQTAADHTQTGVAPTAEIAPSAAAEAPNAPVELQTAAPVDADTNKASTPSVITKPTAESSAQYHPAQFNAAYLRNPPPRYPAMSRQLQEEGRVDVFVEVSAAGLPGKVSLKTSSGFPRLDKAALEVVQTWRFVPANRGGQPEASTVTVPLVFNLQN